MPKKGKKREDDDVTIDLDGGDVVPEDDENTAHALQRKIKKIQAELRECQKERAEHLAGWQRTKADLVNYKRNADEEYGRIRTRAQAEVIKSIMPALDSFENAMADNSWQTVDAHWREGVERISQQLHRALNALGLEAFGEVGEAFNPHLHECMSVTPAQDEEGDDKIAQVLQKGYMLGKEVVRPAKVVVAQHQQHESN